MEEKTKKPQQASLQIVGMTCATCAATVEKVLAATKGVAQARVNFASEKATIEYNPEKVNLSKLKNAVSEAATASRYRNPFSR